MPTAIKSGNWTDPSVWDVGREPQPGERVIIPATYTVIYDITFELMLRRIIRDQLRNAGGGEVTETSPFQYDLVIAGIAENGSAVDPMTIRSRFDAANAVVNMWRSVGYNVGLRCSIAPSAEDWAVAYLMSRPPIIGVTIQPTTIRVLVVAEDNSFQSILSAVRKAEQEAVAAMATLTAVEGRTWTAQFFVTIQSAGG